MKVSSPEWNDWISRVDNGLDITQAARSTGGPPPSDSYGSKAEYEASRAKVAEFLSMSWLYAHEFEDVAVHLANSSCSKFSVISGRVKFECLRCGHSKYRSSFRVGHRCSQNPKVDWKSLAHELCKDDLERYQVTIVLYPFHLLDSRSDIDEEVWTALPIQQYLSFDEARLASVLSDELSTFIQKEFIYVLKAAEHSNEKERAAARKYMELQSWSKVLTHLSIVARRKLGVDGVPEGLDIKPLEWAEAVVDLLGTLDFSPTSTSDFSRASAGLKFYRCQGHEYGRPCIEEPLQLLSTKGLKLTHVPHPGFMSHSLRAEDCTVFTYTSFFSLPPPVVTVVIEASSASEDRKPMKTKYRQLIKRKFSHHPEDWVQGLRLKERR